MSTDSPIKTRTQDDHDQDSSKNYALSGKIMLASIITIFIIGLFLLILHLYARCYLLRLRRRNQTRRRNRHNRSTRIVYYVDSNTELASPTGGLDASVLKSLPLFVYSSETDVKIPECAVCLSEFEDGEQGRLLPNCKHSFHTECIDMWFYSNSTCPLCRSPVEPFETEMTTSVEQQSVPEFQPVEELMETTPVPEPDRRKRIDVRIDVPNRSESVAENEFRQPSPSQGFRSPGSRLLSLKRIINMSRKSPAVSPSSSGGPSCIAAATESDLESAIDESVKE